MAVCDRQLLEVFGTGTAAVIAPVRSIKYMEKEIQVGGRTWHIDQYTWYLRYVYYQSDREL